jgi:long-chain acyl-CoA synthetase
LAGRELEFIINDAEVKMLIMGEEFVDIARSIRSNLKTVDSFFCLGESMSDMGAYEEMIERYSTDAPHVDIQDEDVAVQMYTSGTTGMPKGVLLTHKNLILMYMSRIIDLKLDQNDVFLSSLPFFHTAAEYALITLYIGGTLVIHSSFDPGRFLEAIEKERVTVTGGVPAMVNFLLQHIEKHPRDYDFSSLRIFAYGAAPMPVTLVRRTIETFKCAFISLMVLQRRVQELPFSGLRIMYWTVLRRKQGGWLPVARRYLTLRSGWWTERGLM